MAYFSKSTIVQAYRNLSQIDSDKKQGLTQKVSALKYLTALDIFKKNHSEYCDLKIGENKDLFSSYVGEVVKINSELCTKDFHSSIAPNGRDYDCGSNFYSSSSVKDSRTNPSISFTYPKRSGWKPVMDIKNQVLLSNDDYLKEAFEYYLPSKSLRISFIIWLLRFHNVTDKTTLIIKEGLQKNHTDSFCDAIFQDTIEDSDLDFIELTDLICSLSKEDLVDDLNETEMLENNSTQKRLPLQQIHYGAPGTGKSHAINEQTKGASVIRTTFHPDSDYSTFVGAYKPTVEEVEVRVVPVVLNNGASFDQNNGTYKEKRITYKFIKQAFLKAYLSAWKKHTEGDEKQYLVIEEINRGNCAQIFGDIFQLLDRNEQNFSSYPIEVDTDMQMAIKEAFASEEEYKLEHPIEADVAIDGYTSNYGFTLSDDITNGRVLLLPPNLYIWATMNTSDQSLFPIDSAFKRRWDWKYVPITNAGKGWRISAAGKMYDWWSFLQRVNEQIASTTNSEDKKLGYFFCKATNGVINAETFVGKVIFYLWNDVYKDMYQESGIFKTLSGDYLPFSKFYDEEGDINEQNIAAFLENLGVDAADTQPQAHDQATDEQGNNKSEA